VAVWGRQYKEFVDGDGDGTRDVDAAAVWLMRIHANTVALARSFTEQAARDAAQTELLRHVLAAQGRPMSEEQFQEVLDLMRTAAAEAGAAATARLEEKLDAHRAALAAAARAEADILAAAERAAAEAPTETRLNQRTGQWQPPAQGQSPVSQAGS
jgi:hypothetical protein